MSKRSILPRRVTRLPVRRIAVRGLSRAGDDDWLNPQVTDPVDGHYVVWMRKPMLPKLDGPVDFSGGPFRAYMANKRYPKILLMPEQFQLNIRDVPGFRFGSSPGTEAGRRLRNKWLGEAVQFMKWLDDAAPGCLQLLNDAQKINFSPGEDYNPNEGYFTVVDEMGRIKERRANVLIMGPSQEKYAIGGFNMTFSRTGIELDHRKTVGDGAIITIDTESGTEYDSRQICGCDRSFFHEICHALQRVLGVLPWPDMTFWEIDVPRSVAAGHAVYGEVRKSETDVVSPVSRRDHNRSLNITDEGAVAVQIFDLFMADIDQELPNVSEVVKRLLIGVMKLRQGQIWANTYTEETIYKESIKRRGVHRYVPVRSHYLDVLGNRYLTKTPLDPNKRWISAHDGQPLCK